MASSKFSHEHNDGECGGCPLLPTRRNFLRDTGVVLALAAFGALGIPARAASALTVSFVTGRRGSGKALSYPVPPTDGVQIDRDNDVIVVRWQGVAYAFNLSCPHQNTALRWDDADHRFQCPKHHSQYQPDGTFITGRATRNMDRLAIRRDATNTLVVDADAMYRSDADAAAWTSAVVKL